MAVEFADGELSASQLRAATARINDKLAAIERRQQDTERVRVFDEIPLGTEQVGQAIDKLSPDRLRAIMAVMMDVTVLPVGKGGKVFRPERVQVVWK
jgi:hypothetical protein